MKRYGRLVLSVVFLLTRMSGNPIHLLLDVNATARDQEILTRHLGATDLTPVFPGYAPAVARFPGAIRG